MRSINYHVACSIDGYIADKQGIVDSFLMEGDHVDDYKATLSTYDTVIMGAKTYQVSFQYDVRPGESVPIYAYEAICVYTSVGIQFI